VTVRTIFGWTTAADESCVFVAGSVNVRMSARTLRWYYGGVVTGMALFALAFLVWPPSWPTRYLAAYFCFVWLSAVGLLVAYVRRHFLR
jgi:hypothetical protein